MNPSDRKSCGYDNGLEIYYHADGAETGFPIIMFHGGAGAYPLSDSLRQIAAFFGIRILSVHRPGFNGSPFNPAIDTLIDFPRIIEPLLSIEKIDRFGVIGLCAGAPFAHATAHRFSERIVGSWILSGIPDVHLLNRIGYSMPASLQHNIDLSLNEEEAVLGERIRQGIEDFKKSIGGSSDKSWDTRYEVAGIHLNDYLAMLDYQLAQQCRPMARECRLIYRPWGFSMSEINCPMVFWHAREDEEVPFDSVDALVGQLGQARLTVQQQNTHYPSDQTMLQLFDSIQSTVAGMTETCD